MKRTYTATSQAGQLPLSAHRVVLIPGFLGFDKLGDFGYFANTVGQTLADALTGADPGRRFAVDVVDTVPAGSLDARQARLIDQLRALQGQHPGVQLHLVGHSTGGLDAELLVRTPRPGTRRAADVNELRRAIRSVVTVSAPLAGTTLAQSPLARFAAIDSLGDVWRTPLSVLLVHGPAALLQAVGSVGSLLFSDDTLGKLVSGALHSGSIGSSYLLSLLLTRALIDDLRPANVVKIMRETSEDPALPELQRVWFITVARRNMDQPKSAGELFRILYDNTAREAHDDEASQLLQRELRNAHVPIIGQQPMPELNAQANDGIVNSLRQLPPSTADAIARQVRRVAGIVIADHIDVMGYFPGKDGGENGFLSSGSNFREAAFQQLYGAIASKIAESIQRPPRLHASP